MNTWRVLTGDARERLAEMPDASARCCVTSPPYWGLRDYGVSGQLGLESTPEAYVAAMVGVFAEVRRVLSDDGTLWLNLGDSYSAAFSGNHGYEDGRTNRGERRGPGVVAGIKVKDLVGIPWAVAFALRADGWYLRSDIIWSKPNPMPESVTDRPTKAHEYIFLLSKSKSYYYDAQAIAEPVTGAMFDQMEQGYDGEGRKDYDAAGVQNPSSVKARIIANARKKQAHSASGSHGLADSVLPAEGRMDAEVFRSDDNRRQLSGLSRSVDSPSITGNKVGRGDGGASCNNPLQVTRNKRSVWSVTTQPYPDAHFATFPEKLIEPCILAGSAFGDTVLDPFTGSGTTGAVAIRHQRNFIGTELNPAYVELARKRIASVAPMFAQEVA